MNDSLQKLQQRLNQTVLGAESAVYELLVALLAGGHVLIEGTPGVGKTTLVKTLADSISGDFKRVQFTPDLVPSDLLGYSMFRPDRNEFEFHQGPIFTNLLLADEINRTSPRIQSALLECMNEGQVTVDGKTHDLPGFFHVVATQNNRYSTGTFPLPEPQLDRFLLSIEMKLPDAATRAGVLRQHMDQALTPPTGAILTTEELVNLQKQTESIPVSDPICDYVVQLCDAVRNHSDLSGEISNRGSLSLLRAARAIALIEGHEGVFPEDVKRAFIPALAHRVTLASDDLGASEKDKQRLRVSRFLGKVLTSVEAD